LLICFGFFLLWQPFYHKYLSPPPPKEEKAPAPPKRPSELKPAPAKQPEPAKPIAPVKPPKTDEPKPEEQTLEIENNHIRLELTNTGAAVETIRLLNYNVGNLGRLHGTKAKEGSLRLSDLYREMYPPGSKPGTKPGKPEKLFITAPMVPDQRSAVLSDPDGVFPFDKQRYKVAAHDQAQVRFESTFGGKLAVQKTFSLQPDSRHVDIAIDIVNTSKEKIALQYALSTAAGIIPEILPGTPPDETTLDQLQSRNDVISATYGTYESGREIKITRTAAGKLSGGPIEYSESTIAWVAVQSNYFTAILQPKDQQDGTGFAQAAECSIVGESNATARIRTIRIDIEPGQKLHHEYIWYLGPKDKNVLSQVKEYNDFLPIVDPRGPNAICYFFLWMLSGVQKVIGS